MAESGRRKGTVTAVDSLFPAEEAQRASERVHAAIAVCRGELDRLNSFVADNSALTKLVRQLPDEISHDIMVPFGSAAFFPGRLIHTNEFLVLLGDAYYAERTSKQTVEILRRREKSLESQVEALMASLLDLEAEAKFFDSTAAEAKEGIMEIREEYIEESQNQQEDIVEIREEYIEEPQNESESGLPESSFKNTPLLPDEDSEHARIMARLDELEKEELEAGSATARQDEDSESRCEAETVSYSDEDEDSEAGFGSSVSEKNVTDDKGKISEKFKSTEAVQKSRGQELLQSTAKAIGGGSHQHLADYPSILDSNSTFLASDGSIKSSMAPSHVKHKPIPPPDPKENLRNSSDLKLKDTSDKITSNTDKMNFGGRKAFTGSVIEHTYGLSSSQPAKSSSSDQPSKPVSRFKMLKGNH